ncbi:hypothetical protein, partial [Xanthomonas fragariae]
LRRRLQPALNDALERVFACLDPGNGMAILECRALIIADDWCLKGDFQGRLFNTFSILDSHQPGKIIASATRRPSLASTL